MGDRELALVAAAYDAWQNASTADRSRALKELQAVESGRRPRGAWKGSLAERMFYTADQVNASEQ